MIKKSTVKFRTISRLGGYSDYTDCSGPSLTDPEQDVTIQDLFSKMIRGEGVNQRQVYYDEVTDPKKAEVPVYQQKGFDIADIPAVIATSPTVAPAAAPAAAPVVAPAAAPAAAPAVSEQK